MNRKCLCKAGVNLHDSDGMARMKKRACPEPDRSAGNMGGVKLNSEVQGGAGGPGMFLLSSIVLGEAGV